MFQLKLIVYIAVRSWEGISLILLKQYLAEVIMSSHSKCSINIEIMEQWSLYGILFNQYRLGDFQLVRLFSSHQPGPIQGPHKMFWPVTASLTSIYSHVLPKVQPSNRKADYLLWLLWLCTLVPFRRWGQLVVLEVQQPGQEISNGATMLDEIAHISTLQPNHGCPFLKEYREKWRGGR